MNDVNIFGCGFIGKEYHKKFGGIVNKRSDLVPKTNNILYFISTVDNYNIFEDPLLDIETNLITLIKCLDNAKKKFGSDFTFNFISSWFVYGNCPLPAKEDYMCSPKGFYSITKKAAEDLLISYCDTFDINYRIIRLCNVLGKSDNKVSKKKNAFQYILNQLKNNEEVCLYNGGKLYRDYMIVDDVVDAINLIIEKSELNDIYNIGLGESIEFIKMIEIAKEKLSSDSVLKTIIPPDFHRIVQTRDMVLNIDKLKKLGFVPKYNTAEKIIDMLI